MAKKTMTEVLEGLPREIAAAVQRQLGDNASATDVEALLKNMRVPSRFAEQGATLEGARAAAAGVEDDFPGKGRTVHPRHGDGGLSGNDFLRAVAAAGKGDPRAFDLLMRGEKGWVEGTPSAGGFLVSPDVLPGYLEARRAASPLRERCSQFDVSSDEVWVVTEGNTITVQHVAEAATKPDTTGSVQQKTATNFKVAGTTHLSDELLNDSNGNAASLIEAQFGKQVGITIDKAIIGGSGVGEPTGVRTAAGVTATAVDGQTGRELHNSVLKALSRLDSKFFGPQDEQPVSVVVNPRDVVKWALAVDSQNRYLFEGGLAAALPPGVELVVDANLPINLGAGTNESVVIVGSFKPGAYYFQRQPLTIEASQHAAFTTDETVIRGVERYGFAVVQAGAFEVLTGITP